MYLDGDTAREIPDVLINTIKAGELRPFQESGGISRLYYHNSSDIQVDFSGAPTSGRVPLMVFFTDLTKGSPTIWRWDFGDGSTGEGENILHEYSKTGTYTVCLTASSRDGGSGTKLREQYITVRPVPIDANFSASPDSGEAPLTVEFTDHSAGAMIWSWEFGDDSPGSMIPSPSHTFSGPGTYSVRLSVGNELGNSDTSAREIGVTLPEAIDAGFNAAPRSGSAPLAVQFTDHSTGNPVSWIWDFGDGTSDVSRNVSHIYQRNGMYPVTLTVNNKSGNTDIERRTNFVSVLDEPVSTGSIPISAGWNFVSVPKKLATGDDSAAIFRNIDADGHSLFQYNSVRGQWDILNASSQMKPLDAVWLYSKKADTVPVTFDPEIPQKIPARELSKGWNGFGFTGSEPQTANNTLVSVRAAWENCLGYNSELQKYDLMILKGENDYAELYPYHGYWLFMSDGGVLTGITG